MGEKMPCSVSFCKNMDQGKILLPKLKMYITSTHTKETEFILYLMFLPLTIGVIPAPTHRCGISCCYMIVMSRVKSRSGITGNWMLYLSTSSCSRAPSQPRSVELGLGEVGGQHLWGDVGVCVGVRCRLSETEITLESGGWAVDLVSSVQ